MLPIQFTYLFGASLFMIPWVGIYIVRRDLRPMLLQFGVLAIALGLFAEYVWWTKDWWKPQTITNTVIGIEDVLLAFGSVGVASSLYLLCFGKMWDIPKQYTLHQGLFAGIIVLNLVLFGWLFVSGVNSFLSTTITFTLATVMMLAVKRELIGPAIISGVLMALVSLPVYLAMFALTPSFVESTWLTHNLLGYYPLGIPIEDLVFYFVGGALSFSAYPFYTNAKLVARSSF